MLPNTMPAAVRGDILHHWQALRASHFTTAGVLTVFLSWPASA
jgi:hypothetical protein